jgi:uncharacterized membrane protein
MSLDVLALLPTLRGGDFDELAVAFDAGEWSAILSAAFAALAAIAAFATVLLDYRRESRALRPGSAAPSQSNLIARKS